MLLFCNFRPFSMKSHTLEIFLFHKISGFMKICLYLNQRYPLRLGCQGHLIKMRTTVGRFFYLVRKGMQGKRWLKFPLCTENLLKV